jgi:hypothetical protein
MTRYSYAFLGIFAGLVLIAGALLGGSANADPEEFKALIVVSSFQGTNQHEIDKAVAFYDYLLDNGYDDSDIEFLCEEDLSIKDGNPIVENIENGFEWIINNSKKKTTVNIYISDNTHSSQSETFYQFVDGTIKCSQVVNWIENTTYSYLNYITLGNHSGSFGPQLIGENRVVISSMRDFETADPDQFNITRGLLDPMADMNNDNVVSMVEAYYSEFETLMTAPQTPILWCE